LVETLYGCPRYPLPGGYKPFTLSLWRLEVSELPGLELRKKNGSMALDEVDSGFLLDNW